MYRYRLDCAYDGSKYYGWQKQPDVPTAQAKLETELTDFFGRSLKIYGSGRTDRGVHACRQTAHFDLKDRVRPPASFSPARWLGILNAKLTSDLLIRDIYPVHSDFHSRYSAGYRLYGYRFSQLASSSAGNMFPGNSSNIYQWSVGKFDQYRAEKLISLLNGEIPASVFSGKGGSNYEADYWPVNLRLVSNSSDYWLLVCARSFLYRMVRCIARPVKEVATGSWTQKRVKDLINNPDRTVKPAPPGGCYLLRVFYHTRDVDLIFRQGLTEIS